MCVLLAATIVITPIGFFIRIKWLCLLPFALLTAIWGVNAISEYLKGYNMIPYEDMKLLSSESSVFSWSYFNIFLIVLFSMVAFLLGTIVLALTVLVSWCIIYIIGNTWPGYIHIGLPIFFTSLATIVAIIGLIFIPIQIHNKNHNKLRTKMIIEGQTK
jgi:hypothetical protein